MKTTNDSPAPEGCARRLVRDLDAEIDELRRQREAINERIKTLISQRKLPGIEKASSLEEERMAALKLVSEGMSYAAAGRELGRSASWVRDAARRTLKRVARDHYYFVCDQDPRKLRDFPLPNVERMEGCKPFHDAIC